GRLGAPVFRNVELHARGAYADGPTDAAHVISSLCGGLPEGRRLDILRIPIPAALVLAQRVEGFVGVDTVPGGPDAGKHRRVARIGHRRQHTAYGGRVSAVTKKAPQARNAQLMLISF